MDADVAATGSAVRSSTEFLERGAMVGAGQYSVATANTAPGANTAPPPTPLVLQPQPPSPPAMPSPGAHSPGPVDRTAAELRAMVNALEESHDLDTHFPEGSGYATEDAEADYSEPYATDDGDGAGVGTIAVTGHPALDQSRASAGGHSVKPAAASPPRHSWLESVYSPKVDSAPAASASDAAGTGAAVLAPSPGRGHSDSLLSSPRGSRANGAGLGSAGLAAGAAGAGARPTTPLQSVYGPQPSVAAAPAPAARAESVETLTAATTSTTAGATAAVRTSGGLAGGRQAWGESPHQQPPSRRSVDLPERPESPESVADRPPPAAQAVLRQSHAASPQPPQGGSSASPVSASPRTRQGAGGAAAGASATGSPCAARGSAKAVSGSPTASPGSSLLGPTGGLLSSSLAATGMLSSRSYALEPLAACTNGHRSSSSAVLLPSEQRTQAQPYAPEPGKAAVAAAAAAERAPSGRAGGGGLSSRGGVVTAPAAAGGVVGVRRRDPGAARSRREELFEEEDPAVVLEQSIALLSEVEGLIRGSVGLPADHPLGAISSETANRIPGQLLEALEDTLEVIAMAREELAKREQGAARAPPSHPGPHASAHGSRRVSATCNGGGGGGGGGGGALQAYYGSHRAGYGERAPSTGNGGTGGGFGSGGSRNSSTGSGLGGPPPLHPQHPQHLPPIGGSRGSALGRPPSHSPGLSRSPSQQSQQHRRASPSPPPPQQSNSHQVQQRSGSASRRGPSSSFAGGGGGGGGAGNTSAASAAGGGAPGSARRGRSREGAAEDWMGRKQQHAEVERRKREAQLASDLRFLQQARQRSAEVQQEHEALLAAAEESVRAARSAKAASEAQHRWLQYQDTIAEAAKRHQDTILLKGPTARLQLP